MDQTDRIIDANANRAREALRVMEDLARFVLADGELTGRIKEIRHDLAGALVSLGYDHTRLAASRDVEGDVGTSISTERETRRDGLADVAAAAACRLTESLRSLEECAKVVAGGSGAEVIEELRYRAYDVDRALTALLPTRAHRQWRLCVLISESLCTHCPWQEVALTSLAAGADCIQLREKSLPDAELLRRARVLAGLTRDAGAELVINDRADIALAAGADAVHLGQNDLPIEEVRRLVARRLRIGVSTSTLDQAHDALGRGADYLGLGPMFSSSTKPGSGVAGPGFLQDVLAAPELSARPHLAIGGIGVGNIAELAALGCRGVAVSSAVCSVQSPGQACAELLEHLPAPDPDA